MMKTKSMRAVREQLALMRTQLAAVSTAIAALEQLANTHRLIELAEAPAAASVAVVPIDRGCHRTLKPCA